MANSWGSATRADFQAQLRQLRKHVGYKYTRVHAPFSRDYSTAQGPWKALRRAGDALMENAGEMAAKPLLMHLVKRGGLSAGDLAELRDLIDELSEEEGS